MLGGVCYVDRYAGTLAGIREQIPYFRELGLTYLHLMPLFASPGGQRRRRLRRLQLPRRRPGAGHDGRAARRSRASCGPPASPWCVDFIFNHTSDEHVWARRAVAGEAVDGVDYSDFYLIFPDRTMPDAYERTTREIFPDDHPGSFVQLRRRPRGSGRRSITSSGTSTTPTRRCSGRWRGRCSSSPTPVWSCCGWTPWPSSGSSWAPPCESLPQAHLLLQAFNAVLRMAAPSLLFKSEAIVHPDEVVSYVSPAECQLSYNPLQMALTWEALATRDAAMLQPCARSAARPAGRHGVGQLRAQPRRHRLDLRRRRRGRARHRRLRAPAVPQRLLHGPSARARSRAASRSRRTRAPATHGSPGRRRRWPGSSAAILAGSIGWCSPTASRCRPAGCR